MSLLADASFLALLDDLLAGAWEAASSSVGHAVGSLLERGPWVGLMMLVLEEA